MVEFDVIDKVTNKVVDLIYGYSWKDALRRNPKYDNDRYELIDMGYAD